MTDERASARAASNLLAALAVVPAVFLLPTIYVLVRVSDAAAQAGQPLGALGAAVAMAVYGLIAWAGVALAFSGELS